MSRYEQPGWLIHTHKQDFDMSENEYQFMKQAVQKGQTTIWFDDFTISIPHMSYMERIKKPKPMPLPELPKLTPLQQEKAREKLADIRTNLKKKMSMN